MPFSLLFRRSLTTATVPLMLKATTLHVSAFQRLVGAIKEIAQQGNITIAPDAMQMQAMDGSHVSLVCLHIDPYRAFKEGNAICTRNHTLGVNFESLHKALGLGSLKTGSTSCEHSSSMCLVHDLDNKPDEIGFVCESADGSRVREFSFKLLEIDSDEMSVPPNDPLFRVRMSSSELQRVFKELGSFGDAVNITVRPNEIVFEVSGNETAGNGKIALAATAPSAAASSLSSKRKTKGGGGAPTKRQKGANSQAGGDKEEEEDEQKREDTSSEKSRSEGASRSDGATTIEYLPVAESDAKEISANFALSYLQKFTKASSLTPIVEMSLTHDAPLLIKYDIADETSDRETPPPPAPIGSLSYYLAPKIDDQDMAQA